MSLNAYFRPWLNENHFQFLYANKFISWVMEIHYIKRLTVLFNKFEHKTLLWEPKLYLPVCELSP